MHKEIANARDTWISEKEALAKKVVAMMDNTLVMRKEDIQNLQREAYEIDDKYLTAIQRSVWKQTPRRDILPDLVKVGVGMGVAGTGGITLAGILEISALMPAAWILAIAGIGVGMAGAARGSRKLGVYKKIYRQLEKDGMTSVDASTGPASEFMKKGRFAVGDTVLVTTTERNGSIKQKLDRIDRIDPDGSVHLKENKRWRGATGITKLVPGETVLTVELDRSDYSKTTTGTVKEMTPSSIVLQTENGDVTLSLDKGFVSSKGKGSDFYR
jgi:hypothetical protein